LCTCMVVFNISGEPESVEHVVGVDFPCAARYCSAPPRFLRSDLQPNPIRTESAARRFDSQSPLSKRPPFLPLHSRRKRANYRLTSSSVARYRMARIRLISFSILRAALRLAPRLAL
jgi:hypothetical protein